MSPEVFRGGSPPLSPLAGILNTCEAPCSRRASDGGREVRYRMREPMTPHVRGSDSNVRPFVVGNTERYEGMRALQGQTRNTGSEWTAVHA